jgi:hypothetical protein
MGDRHLLRPEALDADLFLRALRRVEALVEFLRRRRP